MGPGAGGAFFILAESPGALSCQGPLEPGMSPPLFPTPLSSALQEVHPASATASPPPSQALLLCVCHLTGAPRAVWEQLLPGQTSWCASHPSSVPFCQMWEGHDGMALTSQASLGFFLLPLWPSPSPALSRHPWELCGAHCGWQLVCGISPRPPALLRMSHWAWSSGPFSADRLGHTLVSTGVPHLSWALPGTPDPGDPSGLKRVVAGARARPSWKPGACVSV